jgi:hypothetical protein
MDNQMETTGQQDGLVSKPLLLLDIDGVLNAFPRRSTPDYTRHFIDGYAIHLHREVEAMVAELASCFEIVWFTLWNRKAAPLIGPHVGLADIGHLETSFEDGAQVLRSQGFLEYELRLLMYAKTPLLPNLLDTDRPWVWIDDAHTSLDRAYLLKQGFDGTRFRLIGTDMNIGLTWHEVDEAVEAAQAWASGKTPKEPEDAPGTNRSPLGVIPGVFAGRSDAVTD